MSKQENNSKFEVVVIGGSYAGLAAAMSLGRAIRSVLVIDSGKPCNAQTPHSHNFLTRDGQTLAEIASIAKKQVLAYPNVSFLEDEVFNISGADLNFTIRIQNNKEIRCKKIILATGVKDLLPEIQGIGDCWGISAIHCPYCHGYEFRNVPTGILMSGDAAFEQAKLIRQWTDTIIILTNGESGFSSEQFKKLESLKIKVVEQPILKIQHSNGYLRAVQFTDGSSIPLKAIYIRPVIAQQAIVSQLNIQLNDHGYIQVNDFQQTNTSGIYAAGDNCTMMRAVANAVSAGTKAGAMVNRELLDW